MTLHPVASRFSIARLRKLRENGASSRKLPQKTFRYCPALGFFVAEAAKRDEILLVKALFVVLGERHNMVNRQAAVNEKSAFQTNPTAVLIAFENKPRGAFPSLRIAEFIGLRVARSGAVRRLATPCVNATADRAEAFYLKFHTTIIAYLNRTKRTTFRVYRKISCKPCERSPRYSCRRFQPPLCASS